MGLLLSEPLAKVLGSSSETQCCLPNTAGKTAARVWFFFPNPQRSLISSTKKWYHWELPRKPVHTIDTLTTAPSAEKTPFLSWAVFTPFWEEGDKVYNGEVSWSLQGSWMSIGFFFLPFRNGFTSLLVGLYSWISIEFTDRWSEIIEHYPQSIPVPSLSSFFPSSFHPFFFPPSVPPFPLPSYLLSFPLSFLVAPPVTDVRS